MSVTSRHTADERRDEIVAAASIEFAETGYAGTSTDAIARRSGVSQPYLFQLFGTKKELFIASVTDCFLRTKRAFEASGKPARDAALTPAEILEAMGHAYVALLLADRVVLRLQLQAYAACSDPEIQTVVRENYRVLWQTVTAISGADPEAVRKWHADGMLINVIASISNASTMEDFLRVIWGGDFAPC